MANIWLKAMPRPVRRNSISIVCCLLPFAGVLDRGAGPFVGPARQRLAKVRGKDRVRHFVRQHRVENPLQRALDRHPPAEHFAVVEHEARRAAGAQLVADLGRDRAGLGPVGHLVAEPFDGQVAAILLGRAADLLGHLRRGGLDDEIRRAITRAQRPRRRNRPKSGGQQGPPQADELPCSRAPTTQGTSGYIRAAEAGTATQFSSQRFTLACAARARRKRLRRETVLGRFEDCSGSASRRSARAGVNFTDHLPELVDADRPRCTSFMLATGARSHRAAPAR